MKKAQNYIITRFNLGLYSSKKVDPGQWMVDRLGFFERYCVPSLNAQTEKDFKWVLLVDDRTPSKVLRRIERSVNGLRYVIMPIEWCDTGRYGEKNHEGTWKKQFIGLAEKDAEYAIMTRLDNDDALHRNFISEVKSATTSLVDGMVVESCTGVIFDSCSGKAYSAWHPKGTPFITYVKKTSWKMQTVYYADHRAVAVRGRSYRVLPDNGWLMVLHDKNISNRTYFEKKFSERIIGEINFKQMRRDFGL